MRIIPTSTLFASSIILCLQLLRLFSGDEHDKDICAGHLISKMINLHSKQAVRDKKFNASSIGGDERDSDRVNSPVYKLGIWLWALRSFMDLRNYPFSDTDQAEILKRDWMNEAQIMWRALLQCSQLAIHLAGSDRADSMNLDNSDEAEMLHALGSVASTDESYTSTTSRSLNSLIETLRNLCAVNEASLETRPLKFHVWTNMGKMITGELDRSEAAKVIIRTASHPTLANLQPSLLAITRHITIPRALGADMLIIFTNLAQLLERLRFIEFFLRNDRPLKQTLPIFTLIHEEARALNDFIATRALRIEGLNQASFDTLDATNYAITMELRKVFAHELVGVSALQQAPSIYVKIESAHGLLRDCFQQSTIALARLFDPTLDGQKLFDTLQTKLEQSLILRRDLWMLLQLVRQAHSERHSFPIARLVERLASFRDGSLHYLIYKDWETCERFIEEVSAARGATELAPVLHRFETYLETLHGLVNMRAVLADHPFDYPPLEHS